MTAPILMRSDKNPLLSPITELTNWWESKAVFNAGATDFDGKIYLLYRALGDVHLSSFGLAILSDPETVESRLSLPIYERSEDNKFEEFGVEDPRITQIDDEYYIVYNAPSVYPSERKSVNPWDHMHVPWRIRVSLAKTKDFKTFTRLGVILPSIDSKNGTLFPEKINNQYWLLHRIHPDIWISKSNNITHFEKGEILAHPRLESWDSERIGAGAPPIRTDLGWLLFYHGAQNHPDGSFSYMIGLMLLDLENPTNILYRSSEPMLVPEEKFEREGYVKNVVFSCGAIEWEDKYWVYYGGADTVVCTAYIEKEKLLDYLESKI